MGSDNQYDGIDPYAAGLIRFKARQLVGQAGFTASDREDIEQELILDLLRRLPKYNPKRAQLNTFIARVVEHRVATLIEAQKAGIRDYRRCRCSLNDVETEKVVLPRFGGGSPGPLRDRLGRGLLRGGRGRPAAAANVTSPRRTFLYRSASSSTTPAACARSVSR